MFPALLMCGLLCVQASEEVEALWKGGARAEALDRMAAELASRPADTLLRASLVSRELELSRFRSVLLHAEELGPAGHPAMGRALYFLTRYEEALEYLDADDPELILLRVESLRALGRLAQADALLPRVAEHFGAEDPRYRLLVGRKLLREGESSAAVLEFRAVLSVQPLEAEALFGLGRALIKSGEREPGLAALERHRALTPLLDALDFARRGVALAPRSAPNQAALGDAWKDLVEFSPRASGAARLAYQRALTLAAGEDLVPIALRAGRFRAEVEADLRGAAELLEGVLERREDVRLRVRAADYRAGAGEPERARAHLEAALEARPGDRAILERLDRLRQEGSTK